MTLMLRKVCEVDVLLTIWYLCMYECMRAIHDSFFLGCLVTSLKLLSLAIYIYIYIIKKGEDEQ
jgi:hypothetical protein